MPPASPPRSRSHGLAIAAPIAWLAALGLTIAALIGLSWYDAQAAWPTPEREHRVIYKLLLYWGLWLVWPAMAGLALMASRRLRRSRERHGARRWAPVLLALGLLPVLGCVAWARFIEPQQLLVRETTLGSACGVRIALISDLHIGLYMRERDLQRVVDRLNTLEVDAVLIAGDWTYEPLRDLQAAFAPLAGVKHRMIGVLGNHDEEFPGPPLKAALQAALAAHHVQLIDGQRTALGRCELIGLGDLGAGSAVPQFQALRHQASEVPGSARVLLAHNPDTAFILPNGFAAIALTGHTHGGQINLPRITRKLLDHVTRGHFRQGRYVLPNTTVFVSSGIGIDKLPLRFRVPPQIDLLRL